MSFIQYIFMLVSASLMATGLSLAGENRTTIGTGVGPMYNGLGLSYGQQEKHFLKYASLGCLDISVSDSRGTEYNCGVGGGFLKSDIFDNKNNKHGIGMHLGATYNQRQGLNKVEVFVAPQYVYFFNGIDDSGLNLGVSLLAGKRDGETEAGAGLQIGYQF